MNFIMCLRQTSHNHIVVAIFMDQLLKQRHLYVMHLDIDASMLYKSKLIYFANAPRRE